VLRLGGTRPISLNGASHSGFGARWREQNNEDDTIIAASDRALFSSFAGEGADRAMFRPWYLVADIVNIVNTIVLNMLYMP